MSEAEALHKLKDIYNNLLPDDIKKEFEDNPKLWKIIDMPTMGPLILAKELRKLTSLLQLKTLADITLK